jgi:hypothetical protein
MITAAQNANLRGLGYSDAAIADMTPGGGPQKNTELCGRLGDEVDQAAW